MKIKRFSASQSVTLGIYLSGVVFTLVSNITPKIAVAEPQYLDDRSTPEQVLRSYYNAINRKEYVRAYYYWLNKGTSATSMPPVYSQFAKGYANTMAVQLTLGTVTSNGAAGSVYYTVPATIVSIHTDGSRHTFVGCYTLRQINPKLFGAPPFIPMGIYSANTKSVPNSANTTQLMDKVCQ